MTVAERLLAAPGSFPRFGSAPQIWPQAVPIRQEWLDVGLCTAPADRDTAERCITAVYARHSRPRPRFRWVDSPRQAVGLLDGLPTHESLQSWVRDRRPPGRPPLAGDIAAGLSRLRSALEDSTHCDLAPPAPVTRKGKPWPALPPVDALSHGVPLREVLRQGIRVPLQTSLADGGYLPVRAALGRLIGAVPPVAWYGQQESSWIAYYDALRRLELVRYRPTDAEQFADWTGLARSCGWWWPGEDVCVVVERPAVLRTEPVPGGRHGEVRPVRGGAAPIAYRDGWQPGPA
jgi:hypothetical protein